MSTIEATVSMLETMLEEARTMVFKYTQSLFTSPKPANPYAPKTEEDVLSDLEESRKQISEGKGVDMKQALIGMGEQPGKHGTYPGFLHLMGKFRGKALAMGVSHQNAAIYLKETE